MPLRLPPLPALRLFEAAGRHKSFKLAASELGLTPSAVSHGIVGLETWLGVPLFIRGPRGLSLTREGSEYLPYVTEALSMIAVGTQRLPSLRSDRSIAISCAPTFAARWLLPGLKRFRDRCPGIGISVDTVRRQIGFPGDGVDLAIRIGAGPWPGLWSTWLLGERLVPLCTTDYLATRRLQDGSLDLARSTLIHVSTASEDWSSWAAGAGAEEVDLAGGLRFDTIQLAFDAAVAGLGVVVGRLPLADREIDAGLLVPASDRIVDSATGYWLLGTEAAADRPDLRQFRDWLEEEMTAPRARLARLRPLARGG